MDYEHKYASKGAAYGIGIPALVLGGLAAIGGRGFLGGLGCAPDHGHGHGHCCDKRGPYVDRFELGQSQVISSQQSEIALLRAEMDTQRKFGIVETQIAHLQDADRCIREEICELKQQIRAITVTRVPQSVLCPPIAAAALQQAS